MNKAVLSILLYMLLTGKVKAQETNMTPIKWSVAAQLPAVDGLQKKLGVAGPFAGISNEVLLIAGGAYFPDKKPWEGGIKTHTQDIFVLSGHEGRYQWLAAGTKLLRPTAYGASTTTRHGVVCAGGETNIANCSRDAFIMTWDVKNQRVVLTKLPDLPLPLANACMAAIGETVYLVGGESNGRPSSRVFSLNLAIAGASWQVLPDMPLAQSHSVAVSQSNGHYPCLYVIGGRSSMAAGITQLHHQAFCYDPLTEKWLNLQNVSDGKHTTNLSAATAVPNGKNEILVISGDKGNIFHEIETYNFEIGKASPVQAKKLKAAKVRLINNHPGFSRDVLVYNTVTNRWHEINKLPFYGHVTATAVKWGDAVFIPAGEIKPGTRTSDILMGEISHELQ